MAQFDLITGFRAEVLARLTGLPDSADLTRRLDSTVRTAFDQLPPTQQREHAHRLAGYLMARGAPDAAARLARTWMHANGQRLWWMFPLTLDFAESSLLMGKLDRAEMALVHIKRDLRRARERPELSPRQLHEHGLRLARLEMWLRELRLRREGP
jgi:hypothetical protein